MITDNTKPLASAGPTFAHLRSIPPPALAAFVQWGERARTDALVRQIMASAEAARESGADEAR